MAVALASLLLLAIASFAALAAFVSWGTRWGATAEELVATMPGDEYLEGGPPLRLIMTRAISIAAPPEDVWPWLAQLGRGAGWYSFDRLDNGGKESARHIVSWIPEPRVGDASAAGYLRHIEPGRELALWTGEDSFLGTIVRMAYAIRLTGEGEGSRLVIRISGDAAGPVARPAMWLFQFIDTIMARQQLLGIKERAERDGTRSANAQQAETGAKDQYQYYEVIYANGSRAGVRGKEQAARRRECAIKAGVIKEP
jgi:hypothetical protein